MEIFYGAESVRAPWPWSKKVAVLRVGLVQLQTPAEEVDRPARSAA